MPPNSSAHEPAMPLSSQSTANSVFQVQTVGVLPPPIDRTRNAWNAIANTSRPVVRQSAEPTANVLSGPGNGSGNFALLFSTRGDFVRRVRPPVRVAVPPRHCAPLRQASLRTCSSSYRTAPYPTREIMTFERQVQWNPLPAYADYQGMRNELPYARPPAVQVARPQNHYRLHAAPVPVRRYPAYAPRCVNGVIMLPPWSLNELRHLARAQNYASNTATAASQDYAGPQSFVWSEQYVLPNSVFPLVSSHESNYEVPGSPAPSASSADSADTPIFLDIDWATIHRKVFDTIKTLEWSGPDAIANTLVKATFESSDTLMFHAVVILLRLFEESCHESISASLERRALGRCLNLSEPLLIEDFHPRLKLGVSVAASIGCLFRIGVIHGRDVIKCMNFLVKSGFSVHRWSAIHAIVTMAGVKLCNPKYRYAGVGSVYRQLGSIYVDSGAYVWAPEGPSGPSYTLLMEILDILTRWFDIQNMKQLQKLGGIVTHDTFLPA